MLAIRSKASPEEPSQDDAPQESGGARGSSALPQKLGKTRASRMWLTLVAATILLGLTIIFVAENSQRVTVAFLGLRGHISEALALLAALGLGIIITLLAGTTRIIELTRALHRQRGNGN